MIEDMLFERDFLKQANETQANSSINDVQEETPSLWLFLLNRIKAFKKVKNKKNGKENSEI